MVRFRDMTADEFAAFRAWLIEDYAGDIARNYHTALDDARHSSEQQISEILPDGLATPITSSLSCLPLAPVSRLATSGVIWNPTSGWLCL